MGTQERVLKQLEMRRGEFVSGAHIADELGVSRAAVNKSVEALRAAGYHVDGATHKGYRLAGDTDIISKAAIENHLGKIGQCLALTVYETIGSTNDCIKEKALEGAPEFTTVIAGNQTSGRGRRGRAFFSPSNTGLYMSILIRPQMDVRDSTFVTAAAAVAVAEAIAEVSGKETAIKWVNDVYMEGKKICGILTEGVVSMEEAGLMYAVVGIGINVYPPIGGFPEEISDIAGSVFPDAGDCPMDARNRLAAAVLSRFLQYYTQIDERTFVEPYRARSFLPGCEVMVSKGEKALLAEALRIDDRLRLVVRYEDGTEEALESGEVSVHTR